MSVNFKKWLEDMTGSAAVAGGGTGTNDIAGYARPLFSEPQRRKYPNFMAFKKKKDMKESSDEESLSESADPLVSESKIPGEYLSMRDLIRERLLPKADHDEFYEGRSSKSKKRSVPVTRRPVVDEKSKCPSCKKMVRKKTMVKVPDALQEKYGAKQLCVECAKKKKEES
jgi:hypothetical protein